MNFSFRTTVYAAALLGTLAVSACGGGSDDDGTPTVIHPVISDETARLRRMDLPEAPTATTPASAAAR